MLDLGIQHSQQNPVFTILDVMLALKRALPLWVNIVIPSLDVVYLFVCLLVTIQMSPEWLATSLSLGIHVLNGFSWRQCLGNSVFPIPNHPCSVRTEGGKSPYNSKVTLELKTVSPSLLLSLLAVLLLANVNWSPYTGLLKIKWGINNTNTIWTYDL